MSLLEVESDTDESIVYFKEDEMPLEVQVKKDWREYGRIYCVVKKYKDFVFNQKQEDFCVPMAYTNMVTLIYRSHGKEPIVVLSPQPLIDCCDYQNFEALNKFLSDSDYGLVKIHEYPFICKQKDNPMSLEVYKNTDFGKRYFINELTKVVGNDKIRIWLCHNFMDGGEKYPVIGVLNMGDYGKKGNKAPAAKAANLKNPPFNSHLYKRGRGKPDQYDHVVLIYGLDMTDDDSTKHNVFVKNTYGTGWGDEGSSRNVVDDLSEIQVPRYNHEEIEQLRIKDIATIVMQKTINAETCIPYTLSMIENLMHEIHFVVDPNNSSEKQALDVIQELQKHHPIKRALMRLKLTLPLQNFSSLEEKLIEWQSIIVSEDESGSQYSIVCELDPGLFCDCDALVRNLQGRSEILANHYDGRRADVSSSESKKPTNTVDRLSEKIQKLALAPITKTTESQICEMDSGLSRDVEESVKNMQGRFETLSTSVHDEGGINDDVSSSESKKPTETADKLGGNSKTNIGSENRHH